VHQAIKFLHLKFLKLYKFIWYKSYKKQIILRECNLVTNSVKKSLVVVSLNLLVFYLCKIISPDNNHENVTSHIFTNKYNDKLIKFIPVDSAVIMWSTVAKYNNKNMNAMCTTHKYLRVIQTNLTIFTDSVNSYFVL
jgi:hypothetical protein